MKALSAPPVCGILFCYNEAHILPEVLPHYLAQGVDLAIVDNGSTDKSPEILKSFQKNNGAFPGRVRDVLSFPTQGYEWKKILRFACGHMHRNLGDYAWIALIDADAFYDSAVRDWSLRQCLGWADRFGYNILNGRVREFYPTSADDPAEPLHTRRLRYGRVLEGWWQQKIFRYHPSVDFFSRDGHEIWRETPRLLPETGFVYRHYPWVSLEHGLRKIFCERIPRYTERAEHPEMHQHYLSLFPIPSDLVKDPSKLTLFESDHAAVSGRQFLKRLLSDKARALIQRPAPAPRPAPGPRRAFTLEPPQTLHFLLTDYCNARCSFCNQSFLKDKNELSLDGFKTFLNHLPVDKIRTFYLSGGGDPLLCRELIPMIRLTRERYPQMDTRLRTNGLLLESRAKDLASSGLTRLELSFHGLPPTNDLILRRSGSESILAGLRRLNLELKAAGKTMHKVFCPAVSRVNARELPDLVRLAAEFEVHAISVTFWRFYPHRVEESSARTEDSLFYHQELYDQTIRSAARVASELKIGFEHEPLFSQPFEPRACGQPWDTLVVDWDGSVYPCCGGEVWFKNHTRSAGHRFGNLLQTPLLDFWNNESFIKLRRTQLGEAGPIVPECSNCHNTLTLKGPANPAGHLLRRPPS